MPRFAAARFTRWFAGHTAADRPATRGPVLLWPDTFTNYFDPDIARDAVAVLEAAGFEVQIPQRTVCCGLTWISTGQLGIAIRLASPVDKGATAVK